jgi:hypothetical protein
MKACVHGTCCRVCTAPGNSWNLIFKFSRLWKLIEEDMSPRNAWKTLGIFIKYSWNSPDFPAIIV